MKKVISGRRKKSHLTGISLTLEETKPIYEKWEQTDQIVFTWIIQNVETSLINNVS